MADGTVDDTGVVVVVCRSASSCTMIRCGSEQYAVLTDWTYQPFYRSKSSTLPVWNGQATWVENASAGFDLQQRWPTWSRPSCLRSEEPYLEVSSLSLVDLNCSNEKLDSGETTSFRSLSEAKPGALVKVVGKVVAVSPIIPANEKHVLVEIELLDSIQSVMKVVLLVLRENARYVFCPKLAFIHSHHC